MCFVTNDPRELDPGITSRAIDTVAHDENGRFAFGENWARFLRKLNKERIVAAETALKEMLGVENLEGKRFLDIGSGSGLSSLAARRLGAEVLSFDYDRDSVGCTIELKRRFFPNDTSWRIERGSVLDVPFMESLGRFDIVYSWGVLHHTGAMWSALKISMERTRPNGLLFIALYNDQGLWSRVWWIIKFAYIKLPTLLKRAYAFAVWKAIYVLVILKYLFLLKPMKPIREARAYKPRRGMDQEADIIDWMGGFPFEVVGYEVLVDYMALHGYSLVRGNPNRAIGCSEFVFRAPD